MNIQVCLRLIKQFILKESTKVTTLNGFIRRRFYFYEGVIVFRATYLRATFIHFYTVHGKLLYLLYGPTSFLHTDSVCK